MPESVERESGGQEFDCRTQSGNSIEANQPKRILPHYSPHFYKPMATLAR
jgi:hypothetical protein